MKKGLFILSMLCLSGLVMAQEVEQTVKGAHPFKLSENEDVATEYAHWSIIPHIGFNAFDGDFNNEMKHNVSIPNAGLGIEYSFTPVWSLGVDYMFDRYHVTGKPGYDNADMLLNGYMHELGAYVSMDVVNLFFPKAKRKIVNIQPLVGAGYAWYRNSVMYGDESRGHTESYRTGVNPWADGSPAGALSMDGYKGIWYIQGGLNVEFNLSRVVALGVRAQYNYFMNDYLDGRGYSTNAALASKNNDGIFDVTLNMRFKLEAISKTHVRNIVGYESNEKNEPILVHDTTIIIRHDSVIIRKEVVREEEHDNSQYYYVYFDNNSYELNDRGLVTIQQVADRLNEDEELYAVVTGFCDNTGSAQLNYILGDKRAATVIEDLRYEYGVPVNHLYAMGMGKVVGRGKQAAAYGPNRRAQIRLVDKETFDRLKADLDEKKEMRVVDTQTIPLSESARQTKVNEYKERPHKSITADKNTTLSKLARKYYDNVYCWVYLYLANIDRLENPNAINEGSVLIIPELTRDELNITKEESLVLYGMSRQLK